MAMQQSQIWPPMWLGQLANDYFSLHAQMIRTTDENVRLTNEVERLAGELEKLRAVVPAERKE